MRNFFCNFFILVLSSPNDFFLLAFQLVANLTPDLMDLHNFDNFTIVPPKFQYSLKDNFIFLLPTLLVLVLGTKVQIQLLTQNKQRNTYVNQIIKFQSCINLSFIPSVIIFGGLRRWILSIDPQVKFNTGICYIYSFTINFVPISIQSHSFFVTFYRYLCIVKPEFLMKTLGPSDAPKVSLVLFEITVSENHRKGLIQHCERSEIHLHFEWTKVN